MDGHSHRILVVDDDELVRSLLGRALRGRGCEVRLAGGVEEAMCEALEFRPHAAVVDIVLEGGDGADVVHGLSNELPDCGIVVISGTGDVDRVARAVRSGASAFVPKPFDSLDRLWGTIQRVLEQRDMRLRTRRILEGRRRRSNVLMPGMDVDLSDLDVLRDLDETFDSLLAVVARELDVERASIMLFDPKTNALRIVASLGDYDVDLDRVNVPLGQGVAGMVAQTGRACLVEDADAAEDPLISRWIGLSGSFVSVPIAFGAASRKVVGALNVTNLRSGRPFDSDDRAFLSGLAAQLGAAVESALEARRLESSYEALKSAQDRLVFSERVKAIGEMASGVAHDFNNVLAVVLARVESAISRIEDGRLQSAREDLHAVVHSALQGARAIKRIQDFTVNRSDDAHVAVDLNAVARTAVELARPKWAGREIEFSFALGEIPPVAGSRYELIQALGNLIFNAVEALPNGGTIELKTELRDGRVTLSCRDDGVGMEEETRRRLFEPFFTTKGGGHGLGVGIVREIVQRHDGAIEVESEIGLGTTIALCFPAGESCPLLAIPDGPFEPYSSRVSARVLLVDDDSIVRTTYAEALELAGHRVQTVGDFDTALLRGEGGGFDIVITDLNLGRESGLRLARNVRRSDPELPVVLFTGDDPGRVAASAREAGVSEVVAKPCRLENLLRAIDRAVERRRATSGTTRTC